MNGLDRLRLRRVADRLLLPSDRLAGPGMTLGLVLEGELAVHRSAGMASVELGVPIGPGTTFRIASVSKQFTCAAILLLAAEGKLRVDDDVREWLPELPSLGVRITLDHLMHNSSGIRDMLEIMRMGGVDLLQPVTHDDLLAGICRQRGLNFPPGSRYLYSNSNFLLLGRVIEKASSQSLREFLDRRIFGPVGMTATRHVENPAASVPGLATGYFAAGNGGWRRAEHGFPLHGEGGLVSSVEDLALWHRHLGSSRGAALAEALTARMDFTNGRPNAYARGVGLRRYRGVSIVEHGGLWPGYKTAFLRIPNQELALICITNDAGADPHAVAAQALDAVLDDMPGVHAAPALPAPIELGRYTGRWIDRTGGATADIALRDDDALTVTTYGVPFVAGATEDGRLGNRTYSTPFTFRLLGSGDELEVEQDAGTVVVYHRAAEVAALPEGLSGRYVNDDMAASWTIDGTLVTVAGPLRVGTRWSIEPVEGDVIRVVAPTVLYAAWLDGRVLREGSGRITGLAVDGGRARRLVFRRVD
jgi:D-aminopeptidase